VVSRKYVPDVGHVVWITLDPQAGREQRGRRPALVLTPAAYNAKTSLAISCPITSAAKGYPFEVPVEGAVAGVILADHVNSLDWRVRDAEYAQTVSASVLDAVRARLGVLLGL
jgi:mRNA interferase MazF